MSTETQGACLTSLNLEKMEGEDEVFFQGHISILVNTPHVVLHVHTLHKYVKQLALFLCFVLSLMVGEFHQLGYFKILPLIC